MCTGGGGQAGRAAPGCRGRSIVLTVSAVLLAVLPASAGTYILQDKNSTVTIDTDSQGGLVRPGMNSWVVDGVNQLHQQWFWFRIGNAGQSSIDTLPIDSIIAISKSLEVTYLDPQGRFSIGILYRLTGRPLGSRSSGIMEIINIENLSGSPLDFHFYQYSDFDLGGTPGGDTVLIKNANAVDQTDGASTMSEIVINPSASHHELGAYSDTLDRLNSGGPITLSDNNGAIGPGNVTWAYEWDRALSAAGTPGSSLLIQKSKNLGPLVPEPLTIMGVVLSVASLAGYIRRRRACP